MCEPQLVEVPSAYSLANLGDGGSVDLLWEGPGSVLGVLAKWACVLTAHL